MEIGFQGANWVLESDAVDTIAGYNALLVGAPVLASFVRGFLWQDKAKSVQTYFWVAIAVWAMLQLGTEYAVLLMALIAYCATSFMPKQSGDFVLSEKSMEFNLALILFFTYHRIRVYMTPRKGFVAIVVLHLILFVLPKIVAAFAFPIFISSLMIKTEKLVDCMYVVITKKRN